MSIKRTTLGALALASLTPATGCVLEDEGLELRDGNVPQIMDPIPGGGPCKRCIRGFRQTAADKLELCVDVSARYISDPTQEGTPLLELLTAPTPASAWRLVFHEGSKAANKCAAGGCVMTAASPPSGTFVPVELPITASVEIPGTLHLILTAHAGESHGTDLTRMPRIVLKKIVDVAEWPCGPVDKDLPGAEIGVGIAHQAPPPFIAQIAFPWPNGGVRSCSGVLVSPHLVLTAAHCFDVGSLDTDLAGLIHVRFGRESWLPGGSVVSVTPHHEYVSGSLAADVALVQLHDAVDLAIEPAQLPAATPEPANGAKPNGYRAFGYGISRDLYTDGYDWGLDKESSGLVPDWALAQAEGLTEHLVLEHSQYTVPLCQGDSGGPVLARIGDKDLVVAILAARVVDETPHQNAGIELMGGALSFNHGNGCGKQEDALGYAATRIDAKMRAWIDSHIAAPSQPILVTPMTE